MSEENNMDAYRKAAERVIQSMQNLQNPELKDVEILLEHTPNTKANKSLISELNLARFHSSRSTSPPGGWMFSVNTIRLGTQKVIRAATQ